MTTTSGPAGSGRGAAVGRALAEVQRAATTSADTLLQHVPDTGDHVTGRHVDDFVEQASDALRALAESVADTLSRLDAGAVDQPGAHDPTDREGTPSGWGW